MKLLSLLFIFISLILYYFAPDYPSRPFMGLCVGIALVLGCLQIGGYRLDNRLKKIYLRHSTVFILSFCIVFFQRALDYSIGIIDENSYNVEKQLWAEVPFVVSKACALSLIAFSAFLFGYNSYVGKRNLSAKFIYCFKRKRELIASGFALLLVYLMITGIGDFSKNNKNLGFLVVEQAVSLAVVVVYVYEFKKKIKNGNISNRFFLFPASFITCYLIVYFLTGNRGGAIPICLMVLAAYVYIKRDKVNYNKIFVLFVVGSIMMTAIGVIRTMQSKNINDAAQMITATETISPFTAELAGSVNTVHVALANFPSKEDFNYGSSFFSGFTVLVPGLSRIFYSPEDESGVILTKLFFGGTIPEWGWGIGSSSVADVYISFGWVGILVVFFLLGKFVRYLEYGTFVYEKSPFFLVLSFCVYSQFLSLSRGPFAALFLSWDYALILVFICCTMKYNTRDSSND